MSLLGRLASLFSLLMLPGFYADGQNPAIVPTPRGESWWISRHNEVMQRITAHPDVDLVFVGDSITQNYEKSGPPPNEVFAPLWREYFAPYNALNLGYSGDETQHVLWRLVHGEVTGLSPKAIVVLIGTNNTANAKEPQTAEQVTAGVEAVVDTLHTSLPKARLLLIEILPSSVSTAKSAKDTAVNAALRVQYQSSTFVRTVDLRPLYLKEGVLNAGLFYDPQLLPPRPPLHPNTQGQRLMAAAIAKALRDDAAPK